MRITGLKRCSNLKNDTRARAAAATSESRLASAKHATVASLRMRTSLAIKQRMDSVHGGERVC